MCLTLQMFLWQIYIFYPPDLDDRRNFPFATYRGEVLNTRKNRISFGLVLHVNKYAAQNDYITVWYFFFFPKPVNCNIHLNQTRLTSCKRMA